MNLARLQERMQDPLYRGEMHERAERHWKRACALGYPNNFAFATREDLNKYRHFDRCALILGFAWAEDWPMVKFLAGSTRISK